MGELGIFIIALAFAIVFWPEGFGKVLAKIKQGYDKEFDDV